MYYDYRRYPYRPYSPYTEGPLPKGLWTLPFVINIRGCKANDYFRIALWEGKHLQLTPHEHQCR